MSPGKSKDCRHWVTAYVGLGSNLGDRRRWLEQAIRQLRLVPGVRLERLSSVYETEPVGVTRQRKFLNAVVRVTTSLSPQALGEHLFAIERRLGRRPGRRWGPRRIDLDLLLYGTRILQQRQLWVPHPRLGERRFVLEPLVELAPRLRHPALKRTMRSLLQGVKHQGVRFWRVPLRRTSFGVAP
ncbi:MAG: 2-amino-4-hydroxy-6-hydroxymethyldihydropteridine diphosphokinase [Elusimicrobia bacterium]|nr:2-amino-4-hydroxy-6-hydroxymethyldihydropteridine diphosphokinase [Elusimicrobiota bacterium]